MPMSIINKPLEVQYDAVKTKNWASRSSIKFFVKLMSEKDKLLLIHYGPIN